MMRLERHQLELRYEALRRRDQRRERQLFASLAEHGQQQPIVVIRSGESWVVIDGYKRIRGLHRLAQDTVWALQWEIEESAALMLEQLMRSGDGQDPLQQGWLLQELSDRFRLTPTELSERFDKSPSWVSRRLGLIRSLPGDIQDAVRAGAIVPHAAMKYLVPLARAHGGAAAALGRTIAPLRLSTRQVGVLYRGWVQGTDKSRELILSEPLVFLRAHEQVLAEARAMTSAPNRLVQDFESIANTAARATRRLAQGLWLQLMRADRQAASIALQRARAECDALFARMGKEDDDARPRDASGDSAIA
jgi:ParB family transcriptional regulator, chromosome partitioning protein